ncbi:ATP-binding protein [Gemmatimonas sp.]|uniref:ATP-binding protein n=1 Tax=Gemmatimonas sp. TaxID=1962908 RepID=UPI0022CA2B79|nr:ATP-binding protein [Gemmatimonas sp.]MCZ8206536.1 ATP-binding protein [Gemmatimonas sp.]
MSGSNDDHVDLGLLSRELFIGMVVSISATAVRFTLLGAVAASGMHFLGSRYGKGEVGEYVLIEGQTGVTLGRIVEVHLADSDRNEAASMAGKEQLRATATVQLLGTVAMDSLRVTAGVDQYPRLNDRVYSAPLKFIALLPSFAQVGSSESSVSLRLGSVDLGSQSEVEVRPETLFGRHCAILGATGGGKSWTTARIIEECLRHRPKIILLDATSEYRDFAGADVEHLHLGTPVKKGVGSAQATLPPTSFLESDFIALFEPSGKVQGPKLREAIRSLRLIKLRPQLGISGYLEKRNRSKKDVVEAMQEEEVASKLDDPRQAFEVSMLARQVLHECVWPDAKFPTDLTKWGDINDSEVSYCLSLVTRINAVLTSPAFSCVFSQNGLSVTDAFRSFVTGGSSLLRVCLSGVAHEFKAREIVANALGRYLLGLAREGAFEQRPIVVFVDEAHNFLGRSIGGEDSFAKLDSFELIAKEGRKYGLTVCLATQRPRDVPEGVLSQMGSLIVHRLTNDRDREVVERACGEIDRSSAAFLPALKPGEAAIIGVDFPIPLTISVRPPTVRPRSDSPDYQRTWAGIHDTG